MRKPLVSVLINNFNKENFCEKAVRSAIDQDYNKTEVIFYDDNSSDLSLNKIDLLEDKEVKKVKDDFLKKYKGDLITLSTFDKKSISNIKSKILKYVS